MLLFLFLNLSEEFHANTLVNKSERRVLCYLFNTSERGVLPASFCLRFAPKDYVNYAEEEKSITVIRDF